jgi:hypothetical protein
MPPKTQLSHDVLPECASIMATLVEQVKQITLDQVQITETIYGNGKIGVKEHSEQNSRDIVEVAKLLRELIVERKLEAEVRKTEDTTRETEIKQRKGDVLKWWLGIVAAVILAIIAIARDISTQTLISNLGIR